MLKSRTFGYLGVAVRALLVFTVVLGVGYPLAVTTVAAALPHTARGSLLTDDSGNVRGSSLIGQSFSDAQGKPLPQYFQPRPSAAGNGYDALSSGGSNFGPNAPELVQLVEDRRTEIAAFNEVSPNSVPPDAVTASGSGLDRLISRQYADIQVARVARERGLTQAQVRTEVQQSESNDLPWNSSSANINVVILNWRLDQLTTTTKN